MHIKSLNINCRYRSTVKLMRKGSDAVSRIIKATSNDDYTLLIEFEHGNKILFDMKELIF